MKQPAINPTEAEYQAKMSVNQYMVSAVRILDDQFGEGFSAKHPELAVRLADSHVQEFATTAKIDPVYEIATALRSIGSSIEANGARG